MLENLQNRLVAIFASSTMILIGLLGAGQAVLQWQQWAELTTEGDLVEATVVDKQDNYPWGYNYRVFYEVVVDGQTITQEERVPRPLYLQIDVGQTIGVRSLPGFSLPLSIEGNNGRLIGFTVTAGAWILTGLLLGLFLTTYLNRLARLRRELPDLDLSVLIAAMAERAETEAAGEQSTPSAMEETPDTPPAG